MYDYFFLILLVYIALYYINENRSRPMAWWLMAFVFFQASIVCGFVIHVMAAYVLFFMTWYVMYTLSFGVTLSTPKLLALQGVTWLSWIVLMNQTSFGIDFVKANLGYFFYAMHLVLSLTHYDLMQENVKNGFLFIYVFVTLDVAVVYYLSWNFVASFLHFVVSFLALEALLDWEFYNKAEMTRRQLAERHRLAELRAEEQRRSRETPSL